MNEKYENPEKRLDLENRAVELQTLIPKNKDLIIDFQYPHENTEKELENRFKEGQKLEPTSCAKHDRDSEENLSIAEEIFKGSEQLGNFESEVLNKTLKRTSKEYRETLDKIREISAKSKVIVEQAIKHDQNKIRMDLLPPNALEEIAKVLTHGAKKYEDWNYLKGNGLDLNRLYGACLRHLNSWHKGEENDKESSYSHIAHAACCLMMILEIQNKRNNDSKSSTNL